MRFVSPTRTLRHPEKGNMSAGLPSRRCSASVQTPDTVCEMKMPTGGCLSPSYHIPSVGFFTRRWKSARACGLLLNVDGKPKVMHTPGTFRCTVIDYFSMTFFDTMSIKQILFSNFATDACRKSYRKQTSWLDETILKSKPAKMHKVSAFNHIYLYLLIHLYSANIRKSTKTNNPSTTDSFGG